MCYFEVTQIFCLEEQFLLCTLEGVKVIILFIPLYFISFYSMHSSLVPFLFDGIASLQGLEHSLLTVVINFFFNNPCTPSMMVTWKTSTTTLPTCSAGVCGRGQDGEAFYGLPLPALR